MILSLSVVPQQPTLVSGNTITASHGQKKVGVIEYYKCVVNITRDFVRAVGQDCLRIMC